MADAHITRCPFCNTSFRVTDQQLSIANGSVRCGSCLRVFMAELYFLDAEGGGKHSPENGKVVDLKARQQQQKSGKKSEPMIDARKKADAHKAAQRREALKRAQAQLNARQAHKSDQKSQQKLPAKRSRLQPATKTTPKSVKQDTNKIQVTTQRGQRSKSNLPENGFAVKPENKAASGTKDSLVSATEAKNKSDAEVVSSLQAEAKIRREAGTPTSTDEFLTGLSSEDGEIWDERIPSLSVKDIQGVINWDESEVMLDAKERNYIQRVVHVDRYERFRQEITKRFKAYEGKSRWIALSLLMLLTLTMQYAWFNKDTLSMNPKLRIWYERACNYINCPLPDYVNYKELEATDLVIRSHRKAEKSLMVDALLRNNSAYRQPFPDLNLQFRNIKNEVLAHRQFKASEYLKGEVAGLRYIPPETEVRLALEILDPGDDAVNYSLEIVRR